MSDTDVHTTKSQNNTASSLFGNAVNNINTYVGSGNTMNKKPNFNETFAYICQSDAREEIEEAVDHRLVTGEPESLKEWMGDIGFDFCSVTQIEVSASGKPLYVWETPGANICSFATRRGVLVNGQVMKYRGKKTLYATSDIWIGYFKQLGNYNLIIFKKEFVG